MTYFNDLFSSPLIPALGWTLLHSLWQALICIIVVIALLRCVPSRLSNLRYTIATGGLLLIFLASVATFVYKLRTDAAPDAGPEFVQHLTVPLSVGEVNSVASFISSFNLFIHSNITLIVMIWVVGSVFSSIRLLGGWWYLRKLRHSATELHNDWSVQLQVLAKDIGITKWIELAESPLIHVPIVVGYLKPVILVPLGMCSGLSTEQLESIFIHELVHIKRGDYILNILQAMLEALFFFNPFVWIISGIIRQEREHCCDDAVVELHGNPIAYVHALASLAEAKLSGTGLAVSLAGNKNQLLNRIKRIMEKSVKNYSIRERIVPIVLLIVGMVCASWLTIQSGTSDEELTTTGGEEKIVNDTTIKEKDRHYYKRKVTTVDENGNEIDEITIEIDGDEELSEMLSLDHDLENDFDMAIPPIPPIPDIDISPMVDLDIVIPPIPDFDFSLRMDALAPPLMQFEKFSREIKYFRERSGCDTKTPKESENIMEKMEVKFDDQFAKDMASKMEEMALKHEKLALMHEHQFERNEEMISKHDVHAKRAEETMKHWEKEHAERAKEMEQNMKVMEDRLKAHEKTQKALFKELTTELVKDGYFSEGEKVNKLQINDSKMTFNDREIKSSDQKKYREILEKYSTGPSEKELRKEISKDLEGQQG